MQSWEYASYWIWDGDNADMDTFRKLKDLTQRGWEIVGEFLKMPEIDENAGLWILRRPRNQRP